MPRTCYANSCILKSRIRPPNLSRNSRATADPRGTSQIEAMTALRTRVANFSTSSTPLDNINFHRTRTINSRPRRFRRRQTTKHTRMRTRRKKSSMDFFARDAEIRRGNTNGFIIGGWRNLIYSNVTTRILSPTNPMVFWTVANTCVTAELQIIFRKSMFELCRDERI